MLLWNAYRRNPLFLGLHETINRYTKSVLRKQHAFEQFFLYNRCDRSPCLGRRNCAHEKIERLAEHQSRVATACWVDAAIKGAKVSAVGTRCDDPLLGDAKIAPIKKLRDGRSTSLGWPPLVGLTQQSKERWCRL
jgi:hypothetical protein